jgi:hypothetical protein
MNCQEFWDSYPELGAAAQNPHAAECAACARLLRERQALAAGLRRVSESWRAIEAPARVEAGLVAAFRAQKRAQRKPRRMWLPVLTWASAAAILILLASLAIRGREPATPRPVSRNAVQVASFSSAVEWDFDSDSGNGDFIPLPNAQQVGENEDVDVVRVEVPRSAMLTVGLPVSSERVSELVEADVMLGADGLARAVRFVNQ